MKKCDIYTILDILITHSLNTKQVEITWIPAVITPQFVV